MGPLGNLGREPVWEDLTIEPKMQNTKSLKRVAIATSPLAARPGKAYLRYRLFRFI